jgi:hypothetical protein
MVSIIAGCGRVATNEDAGQWLKYWKCAFLERCFLGYTDAIVDFLKSKIKILSSLAPWPVSLASDEVKWPP